MILPLILYAYKFESNLSMPIMLVLSILMGPALTTLFSIMGKLLREGEVSPTKDFFHFYKLNFLQSLIIGVILNAIISIAYFDMNYFSSVGNQLFSFFFLALLVLTMLLSMYIYPIISRYNIRIGHLFKLSISLLIKKIYISISCISIIIIVFGILRITRLSLIALLFGASIICYLIMKIERKMIDQLEDDIKERYNV
jgi:Predicted integral membrane protein